MPASAEFNSIRLTIAAASGLALTIGGFHYAALWPASQLFGRSLIAGNDPAQIAMTFDDGPNDPYTGQLMELLARHQVRATFFVIGKYVQQWPQMVRALHQAGHTIGCHTMTHPRLMYMRTSHIRAEIAGAKALIEDTVSAPIRFFRPPFGGRNPAVFQVLRELELTPVLWNVNTRDWKAASANEITQRLQSGLTRNQRRQRGSNILMHDGGHLASGTDRSRSVAATASLLAHAAERGMQFVTVDRWNELLPR